MRRALELVLVGAFFSHSHISPEDAKCWLQSMRETPYFSRVVRDLTSLPRFAQINASHKWTDAITEFYWGLCDTIHTKGEKHSLREIQPVHTTINSVRIPEFNEGALCASLNLYMGVVSHIAVILAAYNPILLVGLPLLEKFADNPPLTGFFVESQSETLWKLIPAHYHPSFRRIVDTDDEVLSVIQWMSGLPDKFWRES